MSATVQNSSRGDDRSQPTDALRAEGLRIVLGLETSGPGGAEAMVVQLALSLRHRGASVHIASMSEGWMTQRAEDAGLNVWIEPMRDGPDLRWVSRFRKRLRAERIDVFHGHEYEMNAYGGAAARWARLPSIATLHGSVAGTDTRHLAVYRALGMLGQHSVAVSQDLLHTLSGRIGRRARVIHNGTEVPALESCEARDDRRMKDRAAIGVPVDGTLFVAIGSLYPVKDHATLIRAMSRLPGARVAIAGRGAEEDALRALAVELGLADRIHLLGLRDDVPRILGAADVFVQPSLSEGLPLAVLEAMAHQCCVVATDVGGVSEAVTEGVTGLLVPPASSTLLADALGRTVAEPDLRHSMALAGWHRANDDFSTTTMTDHYLKLYGELLPNGRITMTGSAS